MIALVQNTIREALRRRSLQLTLVFSGVFMLGVAVLGHHWALEHSQAVARMSTWAGMRYISFFAALLTTFASMGLVPAELEGGTAPMLITKPLGRWRFVLAKFLAAELMVGLNLLVLGLVTFATVLWWGGDFGWLTVRNLLVLWLALSTLAASIVALSVMTTAVGAAMLGLALYGLAKVPGIITQIAAAAPPPLSWLLGALHAMLPDLGKLNFEAPLINVPPAQMQQGVISACIAVALWVAIGSVAFSRKEL